MEVTAHRYAVRYPGEMQEAGNYVVFGNWNGSKYYHDENNVRREVPPLLNPLKESRISRYYSFDWHIRYHFGRIDREMAKEMQGMRFLYDSKTGRKIEFLEDGVTPLYLTKHTPGWNKMDVGGTMWGSQAILRPNGRTEIWFTKGTPAEWLGPWQHVDFAGYLK